MDLALEVVSSWFDLMDENGWIAREQILGLEARSKIPPEFSDTISALCEPTHFVLDRRGVCLEIERRYILFRSSQSTSE